MGMGISSIPLMENMPAVILALVVGTALGLACHLGEWISCGGALMEKPISCLLGARGGENEEDGGLLLIATGLRIAKIENFPVADMIPAMVLVMPLSALWTNVIVPLL